MALNVDTLTQALTQGARAAGNALSASGRNVRGDIDKFVVPELRSIAEQLVLLEEKKLRGVLTQNSAQMVLHAQIDGVKRTIIPAMVELTLTELQSVINAALQAVASVVNGALGFAVL